MKAIVLLLLLNLSPLQTCFAESYEKKSQSLGQKDGFDRLMELIGSPRVLNKKEKDFFFANPMAMQWMREADRFASEFAAEYCPRATEDDEADALRHYALSCYLSAKLGASKALQLLMIHEDNGADDCPPEFGAGLCWSEGSRMDIHNNERGLACGEFIRARFPNEDLFYRGRPYRSMKQLAMKEFDGGKLSVLKARAQNTDRSCKVKSAAYPNRLHENIPENIRKYQAPDIKSLPAPPNVDTDPDGLR